MAVLAVTTLAGREHFIFPALFALLYLLSPLIPLRVHLSNRAFLVLRIILLIPFALSLFMNKPNDMMKMLENIFYVFGLYFSLLLAIVAYKQKEKGDGVTLVALALLIFMAGGFKANRYYPILLAIETLVMIYFFIEEEHFARGKEKRRSRAYWITISLFTLSLFITSLGLAWFFQWTETKVGSLYLSTLQALTFSPAFSSKTRLQSIDNLKGSNHTVLRIISPAQPSYLIGKTFQTYQNSSWEASRKSKLLIPQRESHRETFARRCPEARGNLFHVQPGSTIEEALRFPMAFMTVYLTAPNTENIFAPKETVFASVRADQLRREDTGVITATMKNARGEYQLAVSLKMVVLEQDSDFSPYLQVPDTLAESLDRLSAEALGPSDTAAEKSRKMLDFFHGSFTYDTAPQAEGGKDAIEPFLFKSRQGHCEFFATAMTLWLRRNGIPIW